MQRAHFETLQPVCPVCLHGGTGAFALTISTVINEADDNIGEAILQCSNTDCQHEYPIIDGIPIIVPDLRSYIANQISHITARADLSATMESLLGDCCGAGSAFDTTRHHLSIYGWSHYGDLDPDESDNPSSPPSLLAALLGETKLQPSGPMLDAGCSVGRATFELAARSNELVLGVDLNFSMLRFAQHVLRKGEVSYPRRRVGLVYDAHTFPARFDQAQQVDFWACDTLALPFAGDRFGFVIGLNVLDCVSSPRDYLAETVRVIRPGGALAITTPYDWSTAATPVEGWLGGHSQRGPDHGAGEPLLRRLLTPGAHLQAIAQVHVVHEVAKIPWKVRLHERSIMNYDVHGLLVEKKNAQPTN